MSKKAIDAIVRSTGTRRGLVVLVASVLAIAGAATSPHSGSAAPSKPSAAAKTCPPGYVDAMLSWGEKCLHEGEFCKVGNPEYHAYGFDCPPDAPAGRCPTAAAPPARITAD